MQVSRTKMRSTICDGGGKMQRIRHTQFCSCAKFRRLVDNLAI